MDCLFKVNGMILSLLTLMTGSFIHANESAPAATNQTETTHSADDEQMNAWMIQALSVAKDYVEGIDHGQFAQSWTKQDEISRRIVGQAEWVQALTYARAPLGSALTRTLKNELPAWNPKGLPPGLYMVVEYNTSFQKVPNSGELLTLRLGPDGHWRVLTYQVN